VKRFYKLLIELIKPYDFGALSSLRVRLYRRLGMEIGRNVVIKSNVIIEYPTRITVGNRVSLQHGCYLSGYGGIRIGDDVSIAAGVTILSSTHDYKNADVIREARLIPGPTQIGSNVWIGTRSSIFHDVEVGDGVVIGAHTLVNRGVRSGAVVVGLPAREISRRTTPR
jgi:acetyltransferase-like isoleucine patch superfamily enzyme